MPKTDFRDRLAGDSLSRAVARFQRWFVQASQLAKYAFNRLDRQVSVEANERLAQEIFQDYLAKTFAFGVHLAQRNVRVSAIRVAKARQPRAASSTTA